MYLDESRQMKSGHVTIYPYMNESSFISPPYLEVCESFIDIAKKIILAKGKFTLDQTFKLKWRNFGLRTEHNG